MRRRWTDCARNAASIRIIGSLPLAQVLDCISNGNATARNLAAPPGTLHKSVTALNSMTPQWPSGCT